MSEFVNFLHEVFESFGPIRSRKMFGGAGIYHNELMFGLVADDELYLKADTQSIPLFDSHDLGPFMYEKDGKMMPMSYYSAPEEIYDDPELAARWANIGYQAAVRADRKKPKHKRKLQKLK